MKRWKAPREEQDKVPGHFVHLSHSEPAAFLDNDLQLLLPSYSFM